MWYFLFWNFENQSLRDVLEKVVKNGKKQLLTWLKFFLFRKDFGYANSSNFFEDTKILFRDLSLHWIIYLLFFMLNIRFLWNYVPSFGSNLTKSLNRDSSTRFKLQNLYTSWPKPIRNIKIWCKNMAKKAVLINPMCPDLPLMTVAFK